MASQEWQTHPVAIFGAVFLAVMAHALIYALFDRPSSDRDAIHLRLGDLEARLRAQENTTSTYRVRIEQLEAKEIPPKEQKAFNRHIQQRIAEIDTKIVELQRSLDLAVDRAHRFMQRYDPRRKGNPGHSVPPE